MYAIHNGTLHQAGISDVRVNASITYRTLNMIFRDFLKMGKALYETAFYFKGVRTDV